MKLAFNEKDQAAFIREIVTAWAKEVDQELRKQLRQYQEHTPEETIKLLRYELIEQTANLATDYALIFQDSARHVDMKRLDFRKRPWQSGNDFIYEWVRKQGIGAFKKIPGYDRKSKAGGLSEEQLLRRIAAAIIVNMTKRTQAGKRRKRKGWKYNKTIFSRVEALRGELAGRQREWLAERMGKDFQDNVQLQF